MFSLLHFSTLWNVVGNMCIFECAKRSLTHDLDDELWPVVWTSWDVLDLPQREHSVNHLAKNYVFPV